MSDGENKYLKKIRFYQGDWKDLEDYWKSREISLNPYKEVNYLYPKRIVKKDKSIPKQTFGLQPVKESKTFLTFNEFQLLKTGDCDKHRNTE